MAAGSLCAILSSPGQTFILALYIEPLMSSLAMSRQALSTWYAVATFAAAGGLPPCGYLADRLTSRRFLLAVVAAIGAGMVILAGATGPWGVLAGFLVLRLAGPGATAVGLLTMVVRRFPTGRGRALSVANLGYAAGEAVCPFAIVGLMALAGWRASLLLAAGAYVLVALPTLGWLLGPDAPKDAFAHAFGGGEPSKTIADSGTSVSTRQALRSPLFWWASFTFAVPAIVVTGLIFHQVAIFRLAGLGGGFVPLAFAAYAVSHAIGTVVVGRYIDVIPPHRSAVISMACIGGAMGIVAVGGWPIPVSVAYGALLGVGSAISSLAGALIWPLLFGDASVGRLRAVSTGLKNCAAALGPMLVLFPAGAGLGSALGPLALLTLIGLLVGGYRPAGRYQQGAIVEPR